MLLLMEWFVMIELIGLLLILAGIATTSSGNSCGMSITTTGIRGGYCTPQIEEILHMFILQMDEDRVYKTEILLISVNR